MIPGLIFVICGLSTLVMHKWWRRESYYDFFFAGMSVAIGLALMFTHTG